MNRNKFEAVQRRKALKEQKKKAEWFDLKKKINKQRKIKPL